MIRITAHVLMVLCTGLSVARGALVRIDVMEKSEVLNGRSFGNTGAYERIKGTARFTVDPKSPHNQGIVDVRLAPANASGLIEFSADVYIIRPVNLRKGNGTILFEVPNRGKKGLLATFNRAAGTESPATPEHFGDGLLLNEGYTLVWLGWQHDVPSKPELMRLHAPVAPGVRALIRSEFTSTAPTSLIPLGDAGHIPYRPVEGGKMSVSVRDGIYGPRKELSRTEWKLDTSGEAIRMTAPAAPGRIYEVIYESADPVVAGLGLAAIRDVVSHLKSDHRFAIGFGTSQSAMVLRALLYEGFNQSESGKQVFDGVFSHVAGGRRSTFQRFTQPSRTAGPLRNASLTPTEQFPFSDAVQLDPVTRVRDGVLLRAKASGNVPKIFHTNSSYEYWGSGGSLIHTTTDGKQDVPLAPTTRLYVFAGGQHGPAAFPPVSNGGQNLPNFNDYRWSLRGLLLRLQAWVASDVAPPASVYPTIAAGSLVPLEKYKFPALPEVRVPREIHVPHRLDFGRQYRSAGVVDTEPPRVGAPFATLVPQADRDGNDLGAVRMPEIACPLAAFTGWNLRHPSIGNETLLLGNTGSYLPFTRAAIEARYENEAGYVSCVEKSAQSLVKDGLLLASDVRVLMDAASRHWRWRMQQSTSATPPPLRQ